MFNITDADMIIRYPNQICQSSMYNIGEGGDNVGRVVRATFINVKGDAVAKIEQLATEICVSEEHNLIVEELTVYVMPPKK